MGGRASSCAADEIAVGEPYARYRLYAAYKSNRRGGPPARKTSRKQGPRKPKPTPKPRPPDYGPLFAIRGKAT